MELAEIRSALESAKFAADEVTRIASTILNEEYWLKINADLFSPSAPLSCSNMCSDREIQSHSRNLAENGYAHIQSWLADEWITTQRVTLERLVQAGWPRVFLFVYRSSWEFSILPPIQTIISERLGPQYSLLPNIWVQHVEARAGQSGFAPHIDGCYPDAINFWIPLTDAGLEHAPMYVVRRTGQTESIDRAFASRDNFEPNEVIALLKNAQALPAKVGDILVWDNHLIHWGADYENGSTPRMSMSLVVGHTTPGALAVPGTRIPSFEERFRFIADALLRFTSRDLSV